jgi:hypothetical protein
LSAAFPDRGLKPLDASDQVLQLLENHGELCHIPDFRSVVNARDGLEHTPRQAEPDRIGKRLDLRQQLVAIQTTTAISPRAIAIPSGLSIAI